MTAEILSSPTVDREFVCSWCETDDEACADGLAASANYGICRSCLKERLSALTQRAAKGAVSIAADPHALLPKPEESASVA